MDTVARVPEAAAELAREHDEIDRLATLISILGAVPERRAILLELSRRYALHAQAEARYLMPVVACYLPDGAGAVADETGRHRAVIQTIAAYLRLCERLGECDPAGESPPDGFDAADELDILVGQLVAGVQSHVEHQDTDLLAQLHRLCPLTVSTRLGEQLHSAFVAAHAAVGGTPVEDGAIEKTSLADTPAARRARRAGRPDPAPTSRPAQPRQQAQPAQPTQPTQQAQPAQAVPPHETSEPSPADRPHRIRALFRRIGHALSLHPRQPARTG